MPTSSNPDPVPIVLHGRLRKRFGPRFVLSCSTPALAIYALIRVIPGFEQELAKGAYRVVRGSIRRGDLLEPDMLSFKLGGNQLHIFPAARGAAKGDAGNVVKIILGVVLISLAVLTGFGVIGAAGGALGIGTLGGISALSIGFVGVGLVLSGVGGILTHMPKRPAQNASFLLSGPVNTMLEGGPVPLVYGLLTRVGSTVISAGYQAVAMVPGQYQSSTSGTTTSSYGYSPVDTLVPNLAGLSGRLAGAVTGVTLTSHGTGYSTASIGFIPTAGGSGATAHAVITGGAISSIVVDDPGEGYYAAPTVTITGDGTGAAAICTVLTS